MKGFCRPLLLVGLFMFWALVVQSASAESFSGFGISLSMGSGSPDSIDAGSELADDLLIHDESGNFVLGLHGFYQGDQLRAGAAFQMHAWGGVNAGEEKADDDAAGVAAMIYGFYGAYTVRHDRMLLNVGTIVGFGEAIFGYSLGEDQGDIDDHVSSSLFYLEPFVSLGVATCRWFGVEAQLSAPIFMLAEELVLNVKSKKYEVSGSEMSGVHVSLKLTFGKIANP